MLISNDSLNLLKKKENTIIYKLIYTAIKCDVNTCLYKEYSNYLSLCSNLIAFPLIIFTSILSIVATMQTVETDNNNNNELTNNNIKIFIAILSIFVAIMSGLQKYFKFSERSEITKNYAKNFEKLGLNIESFLYEIKNNIIINQSETFQKIINNIFKEFDTLIIECDDEPSDMNNKQNKLYKQKSKILYKNKNNENENNNDKHNKYKSYKHCCTSLNNCLSFLCNWCSYEYKKNSNNEFNDIELIEFENLNNIIEKLLNKNDISNRRLVINNDSYLTSNFNPIYYSLPYNNNIPLILPM
jgi:hypothetical protein